MQKCSLHTQTTFQSRGRGPRQSFVEAFRSVHEASSTGEELFLLCEFFIPDGGQPLAREENLKKFMSGV